MPPQGPGLFEGEYEAELEAWLQRRFGFLCIAFAAIEIVYALWAIFWLVVGYERLDPTVGSEWISLASSVLGLAAVSSFLLRQVPRMESRPALLRATTWLMLVVGGLALAESSLTRLLYGVDDVIVIGRFFVWHFVACLFLPWSSRESARPMIPLLAAWAAYVLFTGKVSLFAAVIGVLLSPLILLPGMAICGARLAMHGRRFREQMLGRHFLRMRRELSQAREIHESMFPAARDDEFIRFDYRYAPARDVGGDFIHLAVGPTGGVSITLVDVTGHGIAAALTVNRLSGEIERIRAEHPGIGPAELLRLLNRYVSLTMARHSVYATAVALDLDPWEGLLRFANAGHPPLLLRRATGPLEELSSTGMMLGAVDGPGYEIEEGELILGEGDTVFAYTDGVFEAMNRRGEQLGMDRLRDALSRSPAPGNWPQFVAALVERHTAGRSEDDVLFTAVTLLRRRREEARRPLARVAGAVAPGRSP